MQILGAQIALQFDFLLTCDRLKSVVRTTRLHDGSRVENSAEHSWHLALMALTLAEHAHTGTDIARVIRLLLVHDLVEIGAGDLHFDTAAERLSAQAEAEAAAAAELFAHLPPEQEAEFLNLWREFEDRQTPEARFAQALDALQPMLLTWGKGGAGCRERSPELTVQRVLQLKRRKLAGFPALWHAAQDMLAEAEAAGLVAAK